MTTYSIINPRGEIEQSGLSRLDAAEALLTRDGARYEVRYDARRKLHSLFWARAGHPLHVAPNLFSFEPTPEAAREDILSRAVRLGEWKGCVIGSDEYCALHARAPEAE